MAEKEATVFVIDLGATMGKKGQGRDVTNLDWSMEYVWDRINAKVPHPLFGGFNMIGAHREKDRCSWSYRVPHRRYVSLSP